MKGDFKHSAQKREVLSGEGEKIYDLGFTIFDLGFSIVSSCTKGQPVRLAGAGFVFVPKCAFSPGGNIVQLFGGAIFALHNYLLIGQLRLKNPKWAGVYLKLVYFLHICYKMA